MALRAGRVPYRDGAVSRRGHASAGEEELGHRRGWGGGRNRRVLRRVQPRAPDRLAVRHRAVLTGRAWMPGRVSSTGFRSASPDQPPVLRAGRPAGNDRGRPARDRPAGGHHHPAAHHLRDGARLRHHHAGRDLLRRHVRRIHHVDPREHPGRSRLGGDLLGRLPDGAPGARGTGAVDCRHRLLHRGDAQRAGLDAAGPAPGPPGAEVRAARSSSLSWCSAS